MDYHYYPQLYFGLTNKNSDFNSLLENNLLSEIDTDDLLSNNNTIINCGIYQSTIQQNPKVQRLRKREQLINNYLINSRERDDYKRFVSNSNSNINSNRMQRQNIIYDNKDQRPNMIYNNINNNIISSYKTISNKPNTIIHIYQPIYRDSHNHKKYNSMNSKRITDSRNNLTDSNLKNRMINMKMKNNVQFNNFNNYNILNYNEKNLYKNRKNYNSYGKRIPYRQPIQRVKSNYLLNIKNINQYNNKINNNNQLINNDLLNIKSKNNKNNFNAIKNNSLRNINIFRKSQMNQRNNSNSNINRKIAAHININKNDDENENLSKLAEELIKTFKENKLKKGKNSKPSNLTERDLRKEKSEFGCQISINESDKNEKTKPEMKEEGIDAQNSLLQYISPLDSNKSKDKEEDIKENKLEEINKLENYLEINVENKKEINQNENIGIPSMSEEINNSNNEYEYKQNNSVKNNNYIENDKESENKKSKIKKHMKLDLDNNVYCHFLMDDLIKICQIKRGFDGDLEQFEEREIPQKEDKYLKLAIKKFNKNDIKINKEYISCENLGEEEIIPELYPDNINEEITEKLVKELAISLESSIEKNLNNTSRQSMNQSNSQSYNQSYNQSYSDGVYESSNINNNNSSNSTAMKTILTKLSNSRFDVIEEKSESEIDEEK